MVHQEAHDLDGGQEHLNHELKIIIIIIEYGWSFLILFKPKGLLLLLTVLKTPNGVGRGGW